MGTKIGKFLQKPLSKVPQIADFAYFETDFAYFGTDFAYFASLAREQRDTLLRTKESLRYTFLFYLSSVSAEVRSVLFTIMV